MRSGLARIDWIILYTVHSIPCIIYLVYTDQYKMLSYIWKHLKVCFTCFTLFQDLNVKLSNLWNHLRKCSQRNTHTLSLSILYIVHCAFHTVHCALHTIHCALYTVYCAMQSSCWNSWVYCSFTFSTVIWLLKFKSNYVCMSV